ncbi:hypothetical protein NCS52_01200800 [Fusarium sp. LHS14.1]|nr:hypothetical protein NCS52_01200800 [Fusarium sp. LHS14.1]
MFPGGGHGRGGQYFGPAYDPYGGGGSRGRGWERGRRQKRRGGHGAGWQGGRGGFPAVHSGQNHGQGYGQEYYGQGDYGQEYYEEEYYGQEGYDENQNGGQGDWQHAHESGGREYSGALARSEVSELREQLRSKEEEVESLRRTLAEKEEAHRAEREKDVQHREDMLGTMKRIQETSEELMKGQRDAAKQAERDLRSEASRVIGNLQVEKDEAKNDAGQARPELQSAKEALAEQSAQIEDLQSRTQDVAFLFRFVDDGEFNVRTMAEVDAILAEDQLRRRLYEFFMEGPLDIWACLLRVCEHGFFAEEVPLTHGLLCPTHGGGGASCRLVMVTAVGSVRRLRFLNRTG